MTITEEARHQLYLRLEEVLGSEEATTIMEHLPPVGWADVATKRDLDQLAAVTKADLDHMAAATKADLAHLAAVTKADLGRLAADLERHQGDTKRGLDHMGEVLRLDFRAELHRELRLHTYAILGGVSIIVGLAQAFSRLS